MKDTILRETLINSSVIYTPGFGGGVSPPESLWRGVTALQKNLNIPPRRHTNANNQRFPK